MGWREDYYCREPDADFSAGDARNLGTTSPIDISNNIFDEPKVHCYTLLPVWAQEKKKPLGGSDKET
jgi:hypothetical protein